MCGLNVIGYAMDCVWFFYAIKVMYKKGFKKMKKKKEQRKKEKVLSRIWNPGWDITFNNIRAYPLRHSIQGLYGDVILRGYCLSMLWRIVSKNYNFKLKIWPRFRHLIKKGDHIRIAHNSVCYNLLNFGRKWNDIKRYTAQRTLSCIFMFWKKVPSYRHNTEIMTNYELSFLIEISLWWRHQNELLVNTSCSELSQLQHTKIWEKIDAKYCVAYHLTSK